MTDSKPTTTKKKTYTKPKLTEVRLVPNEAVLNVCKEGVAVTYTCQNFCGLLGAS